jgi:membrane-associated phospholipid phosphatase
MQRDQDSNFDWGRRQRLQASTPATAGDGSADRGGRPAVPPWHLRVAARIRAHWWLKGIGTTVFMTAFFVGYFHLLNNPLFPVTIMPLTGLDRLVGFQPGALVFYLSLWFYVSLPPALLETRRELVAYGLAIGGLCLLGMACFLVWPTAIPAVDIDSAGYSGFSLLKGMDAAGNACPSLHVATAVFSGMWLDRQIRELDSHAAARVLNAIWCTGIVYSTLATKQHVALDVAGGLALGLVVGALSLSRLKGGFTTTRKTASSASPR